ncbi:MAG: hypothetical protein PVI23_05805 [Maricaulaceae bacterium]
MKPQRFVTGAIIALALAAVGGCESTQIASGESALILRAGQDALQRAQDQRPSDPESYRTAIEYLEGAVRADQSNADARIGLGDAYFGLAHASDLGRADNYRHASDAYEAAASLARNQRSVDVEASARSSRARAQMALHELGTPVGASETAFLAAAISEYERAAALEPTAERYFDLADAYIEADRPTEADQAFTSGLGLAPDAEARAAALVAQAGVRETLGYPPQTVLGMLEEAMTAAPASAEVRVGLGKAYFGQSRFDQAAEQFRWVTDNLGAIDEDARAGESEARAEAYYYLSVIGLLGAPDVAAVDAAIANARAADRIGGGQFRYRRQVCLAHIMRGGASVSEGDIAEWCRGNDTPEGQLLSGMAHLRRAQHVSNVQYAANREAWLDQLRAARSDFTRGLDLASGLSGQARMLDWPDISEPLPTADLLEFGRAVIIEGCSNPLAEPDFQSEAPMEAVAGFFRRYRVFACRVSSQ